MAKKSSKTISLWDKHFDFQNIIKWLWIVLITGMLFSGAVFVLISFTCMPDTKDLENPDLEASTKIYSHDHLEIGRLYSKNRDIIQYADLNPHLINALIATEDERFFGHSGIDARGTLRAVVNLSRKGGGSTITQQLAKQFFTKTSSNFIKRVWQKLQEWVIAAEFEKRYTKEEIITMYFNKYDFLNQSFGIGAAAKNYFGKDQRDLKLEEAAVLVGMFKSPSRYNPKNNPEYSMTRRNVVLYQMVRNKKLDKEDYNAVKNIPIDMSNFKKPLDHDGSAPYFKTTLKKYLNKLLSQDKYRKPDGTIYDIYNDGLKIYTTLDFEMQKHAEAAMRSHMAGLQKKYEDRWKGKDPWTYTEKSADSQAQIDFRKSFLTTVMKQSDRYQSLDNHFMSSVFNSLKNKYASARFLERDIKIMLQEEAQPGYLKKLLRAEQISSSQSKTYSDILKDDEWKILTTNRKKLHLQAKKDFNTPIKMKVFDHSETGEKLVVMTPLDSIKYHMEQLQIGSVSLDPKTGFIKTWVGGIDNKYFKIDHVLTDNQVGSTFKTFLYATVISQKGVLPCTKVRDLQYEIVAGEPPFKLLKTWAPDNSDGKHTGEEFTLKEGLRLSKNSISLWLLKELGNVELIRDLAHNMGINKNKIQSVPSIVLGTPELNVLEITGAYGTFANNGVYNEPSFITKIEDADGRLIYSSIPEQRRALNEKYNYSMVELLKHVVSNQQGLLLSEFGGKTGTTNDHVDAWFMGISPELVVGTWVGGENSWIRFTRLADGAGSAMARPYYIDFMRRLESNKLINPSSKFYIPEGEQVFMDCDLYNQAIPSDEDLEKAKKNKEFKNEFEGDEFGEN